MVRQVPSGPIGKIPKLKKGEYRVVRLAWLIVEKWVDKKELNMISSTYENESIYKPRHPNFYFYVHSENKSTLKI